MVTFQQFFITLAVAVFVVNAEDGNYFIHVHNATKIL